MSKENDLNVVRRSLPFKIAGISCALLVAAILVLSIISVRFIQTSSLQAAVIMGRNKLVGDIASFEDYLALEHGQIRLLNDDLVDEHGNSMKYNYNIVDKTASRLGVQATIYMKEGNDFRRVATSIIDGYGNRIVDTFLGTNSPAYSLVQSGNEYFGNAIMFGIDYLTVHRPLFADNSREIIGLLAIGIEMSAIEEHIDDVRNSDILFIVIGAVIILVLGALVNVAACRVILLKPIRAVMDMLKHIRDGDLTQKLTVKNRDEIGEMANHINFTVEKLKSMMASLEQHGRLLDTVNNAATILLSKNTGESFETSLLKSFELVGRCLDVDRVQIWRNEEIDGDMSFVLRYEWLSDYGRSCIAVPYGIHFPYSMKPDWESKFLRSENINAPLCELPEGDREFLGKYGMKSIVILPMFLDGDFWGFFSIDDCRNERTLTNEEIGILLSAGYMMTSAVNRNTQALIAREAEERTQIMIDAAPLCAIFWGKDINMLDCNQEVIKMFGVSNKQEFIDKFTAFSPEYQPDGVLSTEKGPAFIKEAMDEGYSRFEWMHQKLNGELIPAEVTCIRVKYRDEYTVTEYIRDLREQKAMMAANEKIREANERIQSIFEATPLAITMWDPGSGSLIDCNMEAVRLVGLQDKKTYIEKFNEMSPEYQSDGQKTTDKIAEIFDIVMRDGVHHYNWDQMSVDGEVIPFQVNSVRLMHMDRYILIAYAQDMRETNAAIAKMREADERVQLMFDALPFGASFWDEGLNIIDCNNELLRLFDLSNKKEFLDRFYELSPEYQPDGSNSKERALESLKEALNRDYSRYEWLHQKLNGEQIPAEVIFIRIKYKGRFSLTAYIRDLREHKAYLAEIEKAQENLRLARDAAETANRTKSAFLANMSHEIRTPMNSIIGFSELAQDDDISARTGEYLGKISESAKWLLHIINDILDISKIESGKVELEHIPFDLHDIIAHCQMVITPKAEEKGIALYCYAEPSIGKKLLGDPVRVRQIIINLLSNAVKFTNIGTVKLLASVKNSTEDSITICFEVKDSGIGMSPEQIKKIFEPFIQADDSVTRRFGGTGLGLTITKNIIDLMGGTLSVESAIGVGSRFSFTLTFDMIDDVANVSPKSIVLNDLEKPNFKGEVLVCEDNDLNQQVICDHLARVGLQAVVANNGKEGVDIAAGRLESGEKPFDLIFMDIHMPVMDGLEAAYKIARLGIKTPIVALTANIMVNDLELYRKSGMNDFLGKPFVSQELWKCLLKYLPVVSYSAADQSQMSEEDAKLQQRLKLKFVKNNQTIYSEIVKAAGDGDSKLAHRLAHTLKSNAGQIGEKALQKAAAQIEAALSEGKTRLDDNQMRILDVELKSVLADLAPLLAEDEANKPTETASAEKVREIIKKLEPLLINRNPECEDLLDDIRTIPGAEELALQIEKFKFKQARLELTVLKKALGME